MKSLLKVTSLNRLCKTLLTAPLLFYSILSGSASAQVSVLTQRNDNYRSGLNNQEVVLNPANVGPGTFGMLFSRTVDAQIYTQPLYIPNVTTPDGAVHNVVIVGTQNDSVYAFDADSPSATAPLWRTSFINPLAGITAVPSTDVTSAPDIHPLIGITSTPVISWNAATNSGTIYVTAKTKELTGGSYQYVWRLHALNVLTGQEQTGSPVVISASVAGTGPNGVLSFAAKPQNQRPGLLLLNNVIYMCFASHGDSSVWHGWVLAYNALTLQQVGVYCTTPTGLDGGIWQAGDGLTVDSSGDIIANTGNGTFDGSQNFGDSIVKLAPASQGLGVQDYFAPADQSIYDFWDLDFGSGGTLYLPDINAIVGGGKSGVLYLLNDANMGKYTGADDSHAAQSWFAGNGYYKSTPLMFSQNGKGLLFTCTEGDYLRAYPYNSANPSPIGQQAVWQGNSKNDGSGFFLSLSSNGGNPATAVLWGTCNYSGNNQISAAPGALQAYNAETGALLWTSRTNPADNVPYWAKFVCPTIANGKVYVPSFPSEDQVTTPGQLLCYGLLGQPAIPATPPGLSVTQGNSENYLTWNPVAQAISYTIYRSTGSPANYVPLVTGLTSLTYMDTSAVNNTAYSYEIAAVNALGQSANSTPVSATPKAVLPIYKLHCGGAAADGYASDFDFSGGTPFSTSSPINTTPALMPVYQTARTGTFSYTFAGVVPTATYSLAISFADLQQTAVGQRLIDVSVNGTTVISKLDVVSKVGALTPYTVTVQVPGGTNGNLTVSFAPDPSSPVQAATVSSIELSGGVWLRPMPSSVSVAAGLDRTTVSWSSVSNAVTYNLYRGASSGAETLYLSGLHASGPGQPYADYSVTPGTTYYYYATSVDAMGESAPGPEQSATPSDFSVAPSVANVSLSIASLTPQAITFSCIANGGASDPVALSILGVPRGVTATWSSTVVQPKAPVTLTLFAGAGATLGNGTISVLARNGVIYRLTSVNITVTP